MTASSLKDEEVQKKAAYLIERYDDKALDVATEILNSLPYKTKEEEGHYTIVDFWKEVITEINK